MPGFLDYKGYFSFDLSGTGINAAFRRSRDSPVKHELLQGQVVEKSKNPLQKKRVFDELSEI